MHLIFLFSDHKTTIDDLYFSKNRVGYWFLNVLNGKLYSFNYNDLIEYRKFFRCRVASAEWSVERNLVTF